MSVHGCARTGVRESGTYWFVPQLMLGTALPGAVVAGATASTRWLPPRAEVGVDAAAPAVGVTGPGCGCGVAAARPVVVAVPATTPTAVVARAPVVSVAAAVRFGAGVVAAAFVAGVVGAATASAHVRPVCVLSQAQAQIFCTPSSLCRVAGARG